MNIEIQEKGPFCSALVHLNPGERFISEAGAMYRASSNIDIDVTTRTKGGGGGLLAGVKRLLARESFFFSTYSVTDMQQGEVGLSPTHMGSIRQLEMDGSTDWICTGGSYMGSTPDIRIDTEFQGLKGFVTGESISFVRLSGNGTALVAAFGELHELEIDGEMTVDTGHVVAYTGGLQYTITKVAGGWVNSWLAGEGIVLNFSGQGKLLVQSHNPTDYGRLLGPRLPERKR